MKEMLHDPEWMDDPSLPCKGKTELFFDIELKAEAKKICRTCPVFSQCRQYASIYKPRFGVWAGKTYYEGKAWGRGNHHVKSPVLEIICRNCGEIFETSNPRGVYCSSACRYKYKNQLNKLTTSCVICGRRYQKKDDQDEFCSVTCKKTNAYKTYRKYSNAG